MTMAVLLVLMSMRTIAEILLGAYSII